MALIFPRVATNFAKNGYYPTDEATIERALKALAAKDPNQAIRIIDPCAGEGVAIAEVAHHLGRENVEAYAVEYNRERAEHASTIVDHCLRSDLMDTVISNVSFGLVFLNPPYGDLAPDHSGVSFYQGKGRKRLEKLFYLRSLPMLQYRGVLVYIIPYNQLDDEVSTWLCNHYSELRIYEAIDKQFKQVVIFGKRTRKSDLDLADRKKMLGVFKAIYQGDLKAEELPQDWPYEPYLVPSSKAELQHFYQITMDPAELAREIGRLGGLWPDFNLYMKYKQSVPRPPVTKPRDWHIAMALSAGEISGPIHSPETGQTLIVKGDTHKEKVEHTEWKTEQDGSKTFIRTLIDKFVPVIKAWDMTDDSPYKGKIITITTVKEPEPELNVNNNSIDLSSFLFPIGRLLMTRGIDELVQQGLDLLPYVTRHGQGDWGDGYDSDNKQNDRAVKAMVDGHLYERVMSTYTLNQETGLKIWIITEWHGDEDGHITTVLLPSEY